VPSEVKWEHTVVATLAGLIAQQKFYPECSVLGASDDNNLVDILVMELDSDDLFGNAAFTAQIELRRESESLVNKHWLAIEAIARELSETRETPRDFDEPELCWSESKTERRLNGARILEILAPFEIHATIWDAKMRISD
jgi:hypothetical protein